MSENESQEPKIIVDDDWKAQVQKEKEDLQQVPDDEPEAAPELPPASFLSLLSMLGAQAMTGLGLMPDPISGEPIVNRPLAKHCIDTLGMLQEKTQGNLTEEESAHLRDALHQLRMVFVSTANLGTPPASQAAATEDAGPSIELP